MEEENKIKENEIEKNKIKKNEIEKSKVEKNVKQEQDKIISMEISDVELELLIFELEQEGLLQAPKHLKENVIRKSHSLSVQTQVRKEKLSSGLQLFLYGMKVTTAVVGAILLFLLVNVNPTWMQKKPNMDTLSGKEVTQVLKEKSNKVSNALNQFSEIFISREE